LLAEKEYGFMPSPQQFDEVMIVNPYDPTSGKGERYMRFYRPASSGMGYYAAPPAAARYAAPSAGYGYYAAYAQPGYGEPAEYGYAEQPEYGYYGEAPEYAGYGQAYGYAPRYAEAPEYGYYAEGPEYAEAPEYGYYGEAPEYAEAPEYGYYAEGPEYAEAPEYGYYGEAPEMVGYSDYAADPAFEGYVRARSPNFNAGCMLPTNVAGLGETPEFAGYVPPSTVNASVTGFTGQPSNPNPPDAFRPLF
jgi:hypothetical protein